MNNLLIPELTNDERVLKGQEAHGFVAAPLYYEFVKWAEPKVKHPVYGSMRGATPILFAANELARHGITDTADWNELWLNRKITRQLHNDNQTVIDYLKQQGIDKNTPFTFVDNGYRGTIPHILFQKGYKAQTLFVTSHLREQPLCDMTGFLTDTGYERPYELSNCTLANMIEDIPPHYAEYEVLTNNNGTIAPHFERKQWLWEQKNDEAFYKGMKRGLEMCAATDNKNTKKRFFNYLDTINQNDIDMPKCRDQVEQIYG